MDAHVQASRDRSLRLLDLTQQETRALLSHLEPELIVHTDERAWRVRDVVGHLGVWNWEAVHSLRAYCRGGEYYCIPTEREYDEYNGPAADERRAWTLDQVWAEYDEAHDQLKLLIQSMPDEKWEGSMVYPWNEWGTAQHLIEVMMAHEKIDHCAVVLKAVV